MIEIEIIIECSVHLLSTNKSIMSEKLCLQWNDFQENVKNAFATLKGVTDFVDVTLVCEDGRQIEAHKVILAASSPFFENILKKNKNSHPLIYMRGVKSIDLLAMVDFLYHGEANVFQENLDSFLCIAEELQLKGLQGSKDQNEFFDTKQNDFPPSTKPARNTSNISSNFEAKSSSTESTKDANKKENHALVLPKTKLLSRDLQDLDTTVKSMMETSQNTIMDGNCRKKAKICKICGKEGKATVIRNHIEANHLEGVSLPCNQCDKTFKSRNTLNQHIYTHRRQL